MGSVAKKVIFSCACRETEKSPRIFLNWPARKYIEYLNSFSFTLFLLLIARVFLKTQQILKERKDNYKGDDKLQGKMHFKFINLQKNYCQKDLLQLHQDKINKRNWHHCKHHPLTILEKRENLPTLKQ